MTGASVKRDLALAMALRRPLSHDAAMSGDLPVIILLLGATIVPWLLWMSAVGRRHPESGDTTPALPTMAAPMSQAGEQRTARTPDGPLQVRPDGVVLDWRSEPARPSAQGLSDGTLTDAPALH